MPRFRGAGAGNRHARRRFAGVDDVIAGNGVDGHRWRGAIDAVFMRCRGAVAVDVSHPHLGAGIAVTQSRHIRRRNGGAPATVSRHRGGVGFAAKSNGNGLPRFDTGRAAGER